MDIAQANSAAATAGLGPVELVGSTESTNADLVAAVGRLGRAALGRVLVADWQSAGRGRMGRSWVAPPGSSLLCSTVLDLPGDPAETGPQIVNVAVALAARAAVVACGGPALGVKWPNDLVVARGTAAALGRSELSDTKVAGVLSELVAVESGAVAVAGIGINVAWPASDVERPAELSEAASLAMLGADVDRSDLLAALLIELGSRRTRIVSPAGRRELVAELRETSATLGRAVRIDGRPGAAAPVLEGTAEAIDDAGGLIVRIDSGERRTVTLGDVHHLRPLDHDR